MKVLIGSNVLSCQVSKHLFQKFQNISNCICIDHFHSQCLVFYMIFDFVKKIIHIFCGSVFILQISRMQSLLHHVALTFFRPIKTCHTRFCRRTWKMAASIAVIRISVIFLSIFLKIYVTDGQEDTFHEELFLKPLDTGHLYTHFQFTTEWGVEPSEKTSCKFDKFTHFSSLQTPQCCR